MCDSIHRTFPPNLDVEIDVNAYTDGEKDVDGLLLFSPLTLDPNMGEEIGITSPSPNLVVCDMTSLDECRAGNGIVYC